MAPDPDDTISWFEDTPLTNFHQTKPIYVDHVPYPGLYRTAEHAFQAQKARRVEDAQKVADAPTPSGAKERGRSIALRSDWNEIKDRVMLSVLRAKFAFGRDEYDYLMATGDKVLIEGNHWNDTYWGCVKHKDQWVGLNRLGTLLMALRQELRETP